MQQIVAMILYRGEDPPFDVASRSPWLDMKLTDDAVIAELNKQEGRRWIKTHLPLNALPYRATTKYIYVGRDGRDACLSLHNHYKMASDVWYDALNSKPLCGPPMPRFDQATMGPSDFFDKWLTTGWETHTWEADGYPFWSLFTNVEQWWNFRHLPNVLFVHFANLKKDLPGEMRRIAAFLGEEINEATFEQAVHKCEFSYMKARGEKLVPAGGALWKAPAAGESGASSFFNKGENKRYVGVLSDAQLEAYEAAVKQKLEPLAAHWLATGELPSA
mmetsp:Transcript_515/g.1389  ORF Transcript_515/g.1389 Transcript_515/m.1389 type:complete len:275 (+) Transcript_515:316-1140(+)